MRLVHWVSKSSDSKIGKVLASYSPLNTCPDSCSFKSGGCYAWGLFYLRILGKKIEDGRIKMLFLLRCVDVSRSSVEDGGIWFVRLVSA